MATGGVAYADMVHLRGRASMSIILSQGGRIRAWRSSGQICKFSVRSAIAAKATVRTIGGGRLGQLAEIKRPIQRWRRREMVKDKLEKLRHQGRAERLGLWQIPASRHWRKR